MAAPPATPVSASLTSPSGEVHTLQVLPSNTVSHMKSLLGGQLGQSYDDVDIMIFQGPTELQDDCLLQNLGLDLSMAALNFVVVPGRRLRVLRSQMKSGWLDIDVAQHALGVALGIFPDASVMNDYKGVFWTDNSLGNFLAAGLKRLAGDDGLLDHRDEPDLQFCIRERDGETCIPLLEALGESPGTWSLKLSELMGTLRT
ncbi:unnamed protein product [Effrenium voratum]|nr:unnamed protein product [Effrenium voratum]